MRDHQKGRIGGSLGGPDGLDSWDFIFGRLRHELHLSTADIEALEWWEVEQQFRYWRQHPPAADLLAAVHGFRPQLPEMNEAQEAAAIARFKAQKPPSGCLSFDELEHFASKHQAMQRKAG